MFRSKPQCIISEFPDTQSMIAYMILIEYFVEIPVIKCIVKILFACLIQVKPSSNPNPHCSMVCQSIIDTQDNIINLHNIHVWHMRRGYLWPSIKSVLPEKFNVCLLFRTILLMLWMYNINSMASDQCEVVMSIHHRRYCFSLQVHDFWVICELLCY